MDATKRLIIETEIKTKQSDIKSMNQELVQLKQSMISLAAEQGRSSTAYVDAKKKEIKLTADLKAAQNELKNGEKALSNEIQSQSKAQQIASQNKLKLEKEIDAAIQKEIQSQRLLNEQINQSAANRLRHAANFNTSLVGKGPLEGQLQRQAADKLLVAPTLSGNTGNTANEIKQQIDALTRYKNTLSVTGQELPLVNKRIEELGAAHKRTAVSTRTHVDELMHLKRQIVEFSVIGYAGLEIVKFGKDSFETAAKIQDMSRYIQASKEDLLQFKSAAANTITDAELLPMVKYAESLNKTTEATKIAIQQARILARMGNTDLPTSFNAIVKGEDGYLKSISTLKLSKTEYNELLTKEVKNLGGLTEAQQEANDEGKLTIKGLNAQQQDLARTTAFNKIFAKSFGDLKDEERTATEEAAFLGKTWDIVKEGTGNGLLSLFKDLTKAMHDGNTSAKSEAETLETLKDVFAAVGNAIVGGPWVKLAGWFNDINGSIQGAIGSLFGFGNKLESVENKVHSLGFGDRPSEYDSTGSGATKITGLSKYTRDELDQKLQGLKKQQSEQTGSQTGNANTEYLNKEYAKIQKEIESRDSLGIPQTGSGKTKTDKTDENKTLIEQAQFQVSLAKELLDLESKRDIKFADLQAHNEAIKKVIQEQLPELIKQRDILKAQYEAGGKPKEQQKLTEDLLKYQSAINSFKKEELALDKQITDEVEKESAAEFARVTDRIHLEYEQRKQLAQLIKSLDDEIHKSAIDDIDNKYLQEQARIEQAYHDRLDKINKLQKASTITLPSKLGGGEYLSPELLLRFNQQRKDALAKQKADIKALYESVEMAMLGAFSQGLSLMQQIDGLMGGGASKVIQGFQTALSITQEIIALMKTLNTISSFLSLIPGGGAIGAIAGAARADGGPVNAGGLYQWNEKGSEMFIPSSNGYVLDNKTFSSFANAVNNFSGVSTTAMAAASRKRDNAFVNHPGNIMTAGNKSGLDISGELKIKGKDLVLGYDNNKNTQTNLAA